MRALHLVPLAAPVAFTAALVGAWALLGGDPAPVAEHPLTVPETARTITVSATMPGPSTHARRLSAMLEEGAMPEGPTKGQILTDSECTPDRHMISRCRNEVRLADGRMIVLRHPHDMTEVPCLAPGERVTVVPVGV